MTVRVRFAPSPTGNLHIGGARTALFCYLMAKKNNGKFIIRIEDTDLERSEKVYEDSILSDLKWMGLTWDEGPDLGGTYGPYRQSERTKIYQEMADTLIAKNLAYPCFCDSETLEAKKQHAVDNNLPPHYDGTCRDLTIEAREEKLKSGLRPLVRFKAYDEDFSFVDHVRGEVTFPKGMVGDFVIIRSNGLPVYNFCCTIDDALMNMTTVIRGEEHLANTLRQLMICRAIDKTPPKYAHVSLLIGEDRQKLSKRHGATSLFQFRDRGILPETMINYLSLLGMSHPEDNDILSLSEICENFNIDSFSKAPSIFDIQKFFHINGEQIKLKDWKTIKLALKEPLEAQLNRQFSDEWYEKFIELTKNYVQKIDDFVHLASEYFSESVDLDDQAKDFLELDSQKVLTEYIQSQLSEQGEYLTSEAIKNWMDTLKKNHKIKGKGLFMGMRVFFTGKTQGPDLKELLPLIPTSILMNKASHIWNQRKK